MQFALYQSGETPRYPFLKESEMSILSKLASQCVGLLSWSRPDSSQAPARRSRRHRPHSSSRPRVEQLEERQVLSPTVLDPNLEVRTAVACLTAPTTMAFLNPNSANDFLVLEQTTGRVHRVISGIRRTVLDLAVNRSGERGLLG